jgi:hypothetical protein
MSRSARLAVVLGLTAGAALAVTALPASAATSTHGFNLARMQAVAGTDCTVTVGTDQNYPSAYPGTATLVQCAKRHPSVSVYTQLQFASLAGGTWYYWQTPAYTYQNSYGTRQIFFDWNSCIGTYQWRVLAYVTVDGVYRGVYANSKVATWTACTQG